MKFMLLAVAAAGLIGCGTVMNVCTTGMSVSCACVDGRMGAQSCLADGTYGACQCGQASCNASNCTGCCDSLGVCQGGASNSACGVGATSCIVCGSMQSCTNGACGTAVDAGTGCTACAVGELCLQNACKKPKRIFKSSATVSGSLGGLAGADAKCADLARIQLRPGTFKAWLSDSSTNAIDRIADVGPWYDFQNRLAFSNKAQLALGPTKQLTVDEMGSTGNFNFDVWTGTLIGGTRAAANCTNWSSTTSTGQSGNATSETGTWTESTVAPCASLRSLYCIEQ